jgi:hypothetical protein
MNITKNYSLTKYLVLVIACLTRNLVTLTTLNPCQARNDEQKLLRDATFCRHTY